MQDPASHISSMLGHVPAQASRTQADVFNNLYLTFLILGTIVGVIVISYIMYNAYKYRASGDAEDGYDISEEEYESEEDEVARPQLGEIPTGAGKGGGKKLFLSFGLSAILVLGLIVYGYSLLLYVEGTPDDHEDAMEVKVEGFQFGWQYEYPNGQEADELRVPAGEVVVLNVTSRDVWHNYAVPEYRAKTDAIPGQYTTTWLQTEEDDAGETHRAVCYELCGAGHSNMREDIHVMGQEEFDEWYDGGDS